MNIWLSCCGLQTAGGSSPYSFQGFFHQMQGVFKGLFHGKIVFKPFGDIPEAFQDAGELAVRVVERDSDNPVVYDLPGRAFLDGFIFNPFFAGQYLPHGAVFGIAERAPEDVLAFFPQDILVRVLIFFILLFGSGII